MVSRGRESVVLMDPTLCVNASEWRSLAVEPKNKPEGEFCLCYFLGNMTKEYEKYIKKNASGKDLVYICDVQDIKHYATGIEELLWLIDNASMMFTDSFHGVAFSLLLHTEFIAFERVEEGLDLFTRIESLLNMTNLEKRKYGSDLVSIDFSKSDAIICERRLFMINYLKQSLESIGNCF